MPNDRAAAGDRGLRTRASRSRPEAASPQRRARRRRSSPASGPQHHAWPPQCATDAQSQVQIPKDGASDRAAIDGADTRPTPRAGRGTRGRCPGERIASTRSTCPAAAAGLRTAIAKELEYLVWRNLGLRLENAQKSVCDLVVELRIPVIGVQFERAAKRPVRFRHDFQSSLGDQFNERLVKEDAAGPERGRSAV